MITVLKKPKANERLVGMVKALLERCESGDVIDVTWIEVMSDNNYSLKTSGAENRFTTAGKMLMMAMDKLADLE